MERIRPVFPFYNNERLHQRLHNATLLQCYYTGWSDLEHFGRFCDENNKRIKIMCKFAVRQKSKSTSVIGDLLSDKWGVPQRLIYRGEY